MAREALPVTPAFEVSALRNRLQGDAILLGDRSQGPRGGGGGMLVTAADMRVSAKPILHHRLFTNFTADPEGMNP